MGRKGETFPGLDVIRGRKARPPRDGEPQKPKRRRAPAEVAALPPSHRKRLARKKRPVDPNAAPPAPGSKLTLAVIREIETRMASGAPPEICAGTVGVTRATFDDWIRRGAEAESVGTLYHQLALAVARARDLFWWTTYATIAAGEKGHRGRAWLAERLDPRTFAPPKQALEHSGTGIGGAIRITGSVQLPEEIPDGHPSLTASASSHHGANGNGVSSLNGHAPNGKASAAPLVVQGVSLGPEEDPD